MATGDELVKVRQLRGTVRGINSQIATKADATGSPNYVPFRLKQSALVAPVQDTQITKSFRQNSAVYVDNNTNLRMSLEQIKNMNTKILNVDSLDEDTSNLSVGDYIYEKIEDGE